MTIAELSDNDLFVEWCRWNNQIAAAKSWGGALAAALQFRRDCAREARRRGLAWGEHGS